MIVPKFKNDLTGRVFSRITVISYAGKRNNKNIMWNCKCECGNEKVIFGGSLTQGLTKSCGCYDIELKIERATKHGELIKGKSTPEYVCWQHLKRRCGNPNNKDYKYYGARGIKLCDEWENSYEAFLRDMGRRPSSKHSLDRIDVNGNYCKENCRWVLHTVQCNNKRNNHYITIDGETKTVAQWARAKGINRTTLNNRLMTGWDETEAVLTPTRKQI